MLAALLATSLVPSFTAHAQYGSGGAAIYRYFDVPNQNPLLPQPPRPPRPQRQYRDYPTEVGYQGWGFCKGVVNGVCGLGKLAYAAGDLTYGAVQCAGMAVGCGAYALGAVDDPARLVPANPGSWQSGILTSYDDSCKNGEGVKAYGGAVINIATCGIIPLYEAFEDTCETGSDELMQAIGGTAVGVVPVTRVLGPFGRRVARPVAPGGRFPLPMVQEPIPLSLVPRPPSPNARSAGLGCPEELGLPRNVCTLVSKDPTTNYTTRIYEYRPANNANELAHIEYLVKNVKTTFPSIGSWINTPGLSRNQLNRGFTGSSGGRWKIFAGPGLDHCRIRPPHISGELKRVTGSEDWYLLEYASPCATMRYHFAYSPTLDQILLHYFK